MNKEAIRLIDRLYKDLYLDEQVLHHSSGNQYDKFNNIKEYLEKLENIHNKVSETGKHKELLKKLYYDKYVIKEENVPESYYNHQQQIALERGLGHMTLDEARKKKIQKEVIDNQKNSLDMWIDYFLSDDAKIYPFWVKYWAFQGMLKMGQYDKAKGEFGRRTKDTVAPFIDLNREALAMSMDMIVKLLNKEKIEDSELNALVKSGSFQKIYAHILTNVLRDNKNITKRNIGRWVKYSQGSDHMPLVKSLQGYNTGWCTAGESTAKSQLKSGDFYVYYTLDENNEYKVPRIAIRMEDNKIVEIRGVAPNQNLESEMEEVVEQKLKEFPDKEEYYKKVNDMRRLTLIYNKHNNNIELTIQELKFLYEIEEKIKGFGYESDPRIRKILYTRDIKKDLSSVFQCDEKQIAIHEDEITSETIHYHGDLYLNYLYNIENLFFPKSIAGSLMLSNIESAEGLVLPEIIGENLDLRNLKNAKGLVFPKNVVGVLLLNSLENAEGLVLPEKIGDSLFLNNLTVAKNLVLPKQVGGSVYLYNLDNVEDLIIPEILTYSIYLKDIIITPENIELYRNNKKK